MKIFLQLASCFLALHAATLVDPTLMEWQEFKAKFGKTYKTQEEEEFRMKVFMDRRTLIAEHNAKYERGEVTYKMGINKFSDMLSAEYMKPPVKIKKPERTEGINLIVNPEFPEQAPVPSEVNWVEKGAVSPVKDQGKCNAGYAFSITGAIESQELLANRSLVSLSEQNIIDCASEDGCSEGILYHAYLYVLMNFGIDTETSYPYEGKQGPCRFNDKTIGAEISTFALVWKDTEYLLQETIYFYGPTSNYMYASDNFFHYHSGVFKDPKCNGSYPNHSVLVVGYGVDNATSQEYWLVKNSWGTNWGEDGYIRIARNDGNMCQIADIAIFPKLI